MIKTYNLDEYTTEERIITKPIKNTVKIYADGRIISDIQLEIDYTTGRITLLNEIPNRQNTRFTADFEFDIPVRFDTDYPPVTIENHNFYSLLLIELVEVKL